MVKDMQRQLFLLVVCEGGGLSCGAERYYIICIAINEVVKMKIECVIVNRPILKKWGGQCYPHAA